MAINDKENPEEEGTPKSKKDIRKERREMKSIDRQRKAMGGKPLYGPEDYEAIKKQFKPAPGKIVAGTPVIEDTRPDFEYINVENEPGKEISPIRREVKADHPDYEKLRSRLEAGIYAPSEDQAGLRVAKVLENTALNDDTKTLEQKKEAVDASKVVQKEIENTNQQIDNQVKESTQDQTTIIPPASVGGDGSNAAKIVNQVEPGKTDWTLSEPKVQFSPTSRDDIYAQAKLAKDKVPQLAIEKLGVQDYYPEIGRDIAVGTFTGSRIGSQTIYSGAGGLLPLGLYDARKRAIAAEIKKKEAIMDQIKEIPDIAKQFKTEYSQEYMNFLSPWLDAYKDKPESLMSNTDFLRDMNHYKSVAENFIKVDSDLREFEKLVQPGDKGAEKGGYGAYATDGMLEILHKFKAGFLPGKTTDWLTGKKNISKIAETVQAIPNGYKFVGDQIKTLLDKGQIERVIKPKEGKEVDWTKAKDEIDGIAQQVKDGSTDYESYLTVVKKYYDIDTRSLAEQFVKGNSLNALTDKEEEEYINSLTLFADAQIPAESFMAKIDRQTNDNSENWRAQLDLQNAREDRAFRAEQARLDREDSITKLEMEEMLEKGEKVRTVRTPEARIGDESPDNAIYNVYDPQQGKFRQVTGASIKRDQKSGYKYYDRTGKNLFEVPSGSFSYQQGNVTYLNNNGNIKAISKGTGYTTKYNAITGQTDLIPMNVDVSLPVTEMTISSGKIDNGRAGEFDVNRGRTVAGSAQSTLGTGTKVISSGSSRTW